MSPYSYDRCTAASSWRPQEQVVYHQDLKGLAKFWEAKLKIAAQEFNGASDEDLYSAAEYLKDVGQAHQHDLSYLRMIVKEMEDAVKRFDREINEAIRISR